MVGLDGLSGVFVHVIGGIGEKDERTRNEALYGIPMGRLAKMASNRFPSPDLNARLCEISCMARKRFWFAVAPTIYAVRINGQERGELLRRR